MLANGLFDIAESRGISRYEKSENIFDLWLTSRCSEAELFDKGFSSFNAIENVCHCWISNVRQNM
jgi:hypothetical protein